MGDPRIVVNTYPVDFANGSYAGHTNVSFYDANGNHVGTFGSGPGVQSSMPLSFGGVHMEDPNRPASYQQSIIFHDTAHQWNNALNYAQNAVNYTMGGAGDYFPIGLNCYDFVDKLVEQAGLGSNSAYQWMQPGTPVYAYGWVQSVMFNDWSFGQLYNLYMHDEQAAYQFADTLHQYEAVRHYRTGSYETTDEEIVVNGRIDTIRENTWVSPLAIDLDGDGFEVTNIADTSASFDYYGNGRQLTTAWLGASDAFLVHDVDGDGSISSLSEMFGGARYGEGFSKLSTFDSNDDGAIDNTDANWSSLKLWIDANGDGLSQAGELHGLEDFGVSSLSLASQKTSVRIGDGYIAETSSAEVNGKTVEFADIFFRLGGLAEGPVVTDGIML